MIRFLFSIIALCAVTMASPAFADDDADFKKAFHDLENKPGISTELTEEQKALLAKVAAKKIADAQAKALKAAHEQELAEQRRLKIEADKIARAQKAQEMAQKAAEAKAEKLAADRREKEAREARLKEQKAEELQRKADAERQAQAAALAKAEAKAQAKALAKAEAAQKIADQKAQDAQAQAAQVKAAQNRLAPVKQADAQGSESNGEMPSSSLTKPSPNRPLVAEGLRAIAKVRAAENKASGSAGRFSVRSGDDLQAVITRWSAENGWSVQWKSDYAFSIAGNAGFGPDFKSAIEGLINAMQEARPAPAVDLYPDNKMVVVLDGLTAVR